MRYIPTGHLKAGQKLAYDLVLPGNRIMLRRGKALTVSLINRIDILGFQGAYIDDRISAGIDIPCVITPQLKMSAKDDLTALMNSVERKTVSEIPKKMFTLKKQIMSIVDNIMHNDNVMINMMDIRTHDDYTYSHSLNVGVLSAVIGTVLRLSKQDLFELTMGAVLHDIGKLFVDKQILNKPSSLTSEEFEHIKKHSELGFNFLLNDEHITEASKIAILQHHEAFDGTGYPKGIIGREIDFYARIICVADSYDALTSDRPYRKAMLPSDAIEYIMSEYGTKFDPEIVDATIKKIAPYPIGTCIRLSNGLDAIVLENFEYAILRPKIRILNEEPERIIDLANDRDSFKVTITDIVNY